MRIQHCARPRHAAMSSNLRVRARAAAATPIPFQRIAEGFVREVGLRHLLHPAVAANKITGHAIYDLDGGKFIFNYCDGQKFLRRTVATGRTQTNADDLRTAVSQLAMASNHALFTEALKTYQRETADASALEWRFSTCPVLQPVWAPYPAIPGDIVMLSGLITGFYIAPYSETLPDDDRQGELLGHFRSALTPDLFFTQIRFGIESVFKSASDPTKSYKAGFFTAHERRGYRLAFHMPPQELRELKMFNAGAAIVKGFIEKGVAEQVNQVTEAWIHKGLPPIPMVWLIAARPAHGASRILEGGMDVDIYFGTETRGLRLSQIAIDLLEPWTPASPI